MAEKMVNGGQAFPYTVTQNDIYITYRFTCDGLLLSNKTCKMAITLSLAYHLFMFVI